LGHGKWEALEGCGRRVRGGNVDIAGLRLDNIRLLRKGVIVNVRVDIKVLGGYKGSENGRDGLNWLVA
jgi:hypothetical protein